MDEVTAHKWDRAAASFDLMNGLGPELRWAAPKKALFFLLKFPCTEDNDHLPLLPNLEKAHHYVRDSRDSR